MNKSKQQPQTGTFSLDEVMEAVREDRQKDIDAGREYYPMNEARTRAAAENTEAVTKITIINDNDSSPANDSHSPTEEASPMEYSELLQAGVDEGILADAPVEAEAAPKQSNWDEASLVEAINHSFENVDRLTKDAKQYRIAAGKALMEASKHVPAGEWGRWCKANVKRSERDIRKVMKIAGAGDPQAAVDVEREQNREARAERRGRSSDARKVNNDDLSASTSALSDKDARLAERDAEIAKLKVELAKATGDAVKWESEYNVIGAERFQLYTEVVSLRKDKEVLEKKLAEQGDELRFYNQYMDASAEGPFTKDDWTILAKCLHPDGAPSAEMKTRAMQLLNVRKAFLMGKPSPRDRRKAA